MHIPQEKKKTKDISSQAAKKYILNILTEGQSKAIFTNHQRQKKTADTFTWKYPKDFFKTYYIQYRLWCIWTIPLGCPLNEPCIQSFYIHSDSAIAIKPVFWKEENWFRKISPIWRPFWRPFYVNPAVVCTNFLQVFLQLICVNCAVHALYNLCLVTVPTQWCVCLTNCYLLLIAALTCVH